MAAGSQILAPPRTTADSATPGGVDEVAPPPRSLRRLALAGSAWTMAGYGAGQILRLASNVVLARLLFPEAFGLMALVAVYMQGLQMFSDIGVAPSIIQNRRGEDGVFLNTAWTIQVVRGALLWLVACAGAAPFARFMGEPLLAWLLPVGGLTAVIAGFNSTAVATLNRRLTLGKMTLWELSGQLTSISVMVVWALLHPSVWALVAGGLAGAGFRMLSSHRLIRGYRNRLGWDRAAARALFRFGRWIFLSTALTFLALQLDKLLLGKLLDVQRLGVYCIAIGFALFGTRLVKGVGGRVAFPALSELARERPHRLRHHLRVMRLALIGASAAVLLPMAVGGHWLIGLLYDDRYLDAGWMLQLLAAGAIAGAVASSAGHALLALGHSRQITMLLSTQLLLLVAATTAGYHWRGEVGLVLGIASVEVLNYPFVALVLRRLNLWQPGIDLPVLAAGAAALGAGLWLNDGFVAVLRG